MGTLRCQKLPGGDVRLNLRQAAAEDLAGAVPIDGHADDGLGFDGNVTSKDGLADLRRFQEVPKEPDVGVQIPGHPVRGPGRDRFARLDELNEFLEPVAHP